MKVAALLRDLDDLFNGNVVHETTKNPTTTSKSLIAKSKILPFIIVVVEQQEFVLYAKSYPHFSYMILPAANRSVGYTHSVI